MNKLGYTFDQAKEKFEYLEANKGREYFGYIHDFTIGWVEGLPACLIGTELAMPGRNNDVSGKEAVERTQKSLEKENLTEHVLLLYPENYQELTVKNKGAHCTVEMIIIADNLLDFGKILKTLPSFSADVISDEITKGQIIQQKTENWIEKLKVA